MKKTSTLVMSLLLAAGAWCGLAYAAEGETTTTPAEQNTATFDFNKENAYGLSPRDNNFEPDGTTITEGAISIKTINGKGSGARLWAEQKNNEPTGEYTFRVMKQSSLEFSVDKGAIEEITFTGKDLATFTPAEDSGFTAAESNTGTTATYTGNAKTVTFNNGTSKTAVFNTIVVKYTDEEAPADTRETPIFFYDGAPVTTILGEYFYSPRMGAHLPDDPSGYEHFINYTVTSSNPEVVEVIDGMYLEVVGVGKTEITQTVAATETYKGATMSFTITVLPEHTVFNSAYGKEFTLENPEDNGNAVEIWTVSEQYENMQANGYINNANFASSAMAVSEAINITENYGAELDFDQAINFLKGNPVADYLGIYVAVVENGGNEEGGEDDFGGVDPLYYATEGEAALNWVEIKDAVTAPEKDSDEYFANKTIDLSEYAGKTIKIGFKYTSTADVAPRWRVRNINVHLVDLLKPLKDEAIAELAKYIALIPNASEYMIQNYAYTINACETEEAIEKAFDYCLAQIIDMVYATMEETFSWKVGEKYVSYVEVPDADEPGQDGISSIASLNGQTVIYDLQGRRVNHATNGIYIINGKKVIVKNGANTAALAETEAEPADDAETPETSETPETGNEEKPAKKPGISPWQLAAYSHASLFSAERVNERSWGGYDATEGSESEETTTDRKSNDENAVIICNNQTGLYIGQPTAAGEPVPSVEDKAEAGYFCLKAVDGKIALADDATGLYVTFQGEMGMTLSETPENIIVEELNAWDKDSDYKISAEFSGAKFENYNWHTEEITTISIAVSPDAKPTGFGGIQLTTYNQTTYEFDVLLSISGKNLAEMTPEKGQGTSIEYEMTGPILTPFEANVYTIALREKITTPGIYNLEVADGTFAVETEDGVVYSPMGYNSVMIEGTIEVEGWQPVVTPAAGNVTELETITIKPAEGNLYCSISSDVWNILNPAERPTLKLTKGEEVIMSWNADYLTNDAYIFPESADDPDIYELKLAEKITAPGTYSLTIPAGFFENESYTLSEETVITWTIE